jgi:hypothetical protein
VINPFSLYPFYRETWGYYDPPAIAQLAPLAYDDCYDPKYYKAPDDDQEVMVLGVNGNYLEYGLEITPGSIITHIYHRPATGGFDVPGFVFSMTDMSQKDPRTGNPIKLFDQTPDIFVSNNGPGFFPWLLNKPYPVVGSGLFKIQFWNNSGGDLRVNMVFGVQEVRVCKY